MKEINIGKRILVNRKEHGITQDELAEYIGVSKASVSKWETGQSYPDITFLPLLAAYFDISIDDLIGYEPQMLEKDVKKLYTKLSEAFATEEFDQVMESINSYLKKYYSCYILQYYMAQLLLNYGASVSDQKKQVEMFQQAQKICERIIEESGDIKLSKHAISIQAFAALMLKEPERVITLLEDELEPGSDNRTLLANAYLMKGDKQHSDQTLQYSMYEYLIKLLSSLQMYLSSHLDQPELFQTVLDRCLSVSKAFQVEDLHQNVMAQIYLTAAYGYVMQQNMEKGMDMLECYIDVCSRFEYPVRIKGDAFFNQIEELFREYNLGDVAPRNEQAIKESIKNAVLQNPVFASLKENKRYQHIVSRLKAI